MVRIIRNKKGKDYKQNNTVDDLIESVEDRMTSSQQIIEYILDVR